MTLALPLALTTDGRLVSLVDGSVADLAQRVGVLCNTLPGKFSVEPGFGLGRQRHLEGGADVAEITRQISEYVPDASTILAEDPSALDDALDVLGVQVTRR